MRFMLNSKHISVSIRYLNDKSRNADFKDGVKIMNTGVVVRSAKEYLDHIYDTWLDDSFEYVMKISMKRRYVNEIF